ncbi:MAG: rhodanese-like domain-containing protein [Nitriliruptoraceae bacterium]
MKDSPGAYLHRVAINAANSRFLRVGAERRATESAAGHIPGAISIPPDQLDQALEALPGGGDIVTYCRGPYRVDADDAVRALRARGRRFVRLEEGLPEWRRTGWAIEA